MPISLYWAINVSRLKDVYGISLTFNQQIVILLMPLLASIGSVGVPGSALIVMTMVFTQVGLPLEGIALVAGIDRILDMARTTLNVMGDPIWVIQQVPLLFPGLRENQTLNILNR